MFVSILLSLFSGAFAAPPPSTILKIGSSCPSSYSTSYSNYCLEN